MKPASTSSPRPPQNGCIALRDLALGLPEQCEGLSNPPSVLEWHLVHHLSLCCTLCRGTIEHGARRSMLRRWSSRLARALEKVVKTSVVLVNRLAPLHRAAVKAARHLDSRKTLGTIGGAP